MRTQKRRHLAAAGIVMLLAQAACGGSGPEDTTATATQSLQGAPPDPDELARMQDYLDKRDSKEDVVHSFKQPSGDVVDCVIRDRQPALRDLAPEERAVAAPPQFSAGEPAQPAPGMEAFLVDGALDDNGKPRS